MLIVKDVIDQVAIDKPNYKKIAIYYYADLVNSKDDTIMPDEFVGVALYHNGYLDTREDPDGWTLEDEVAHWHYAKGRPQDEANRIVSVDINLGKWDCI